MYISFSRPLVLAWERAKRMLFRADEWPERWFVTGLAVFLAGLVGYGTSWQSRFNPWTGDASPHEFSRSLIADSALLFLIGAFAVFGFVLYVALLWVSSRAKFVFLENVVRERPAFIEPWQRYARQGNTLFLFRFIVVLLTFAITVIVIGPPILLGGIASFASQSWGWGVGGVFLAVVFGMVLGVTFAYVNCFLDNFIVPIMYRDGLSAVDAWLKFLPLLRERPAEFLLYGLILLVLVVLTAIVVGVAGVLTCCIGLFLLAIPYIGTVLLLPLWVTYRGYGPEFLAQFGPEWVILPPPESSPATPQPGSPLVRASSGEDGAPPSPQPPPQEPGSAVPPEPPPVPRAPEAPEPPEPPEDSDSTPDRGRDDPSRPPTGGAGEDDR